MDQNEYVVGWGTLALINSGLAQSKNRSGIIWFVVSLVLGPIATFCVVVVGPEPRKQPGRGRPGRDQPDPGPATGQTTPAQGS